MPRKTLLGADRVDAAVEPSMRPRPDAAENLGDDDGGRDAAAGLQ